MLKKKFLFLLIAIIAFIFNEKAFGQNSKTYVEFLTIGEINMKQHPILILFNGDSSVWENNPFFKELTIKEYHLIAPSNYSPSSRYYQIMRTGETLRERAKFLGVSPAALVLSINFAYLARNQKNIWEYDKKIDIDQPFETNAYLETISNFKIE